MLFTMRETYVDRNPKSHNVLGIAPVAIIDRQLPFEYTITSRSTDVVVMTHPVQNINHLAFRSMFEREKLSGNNFNDWFRQLKLVLRVEKKMFIIEQLLPAALATNSKAQVLLEWNAVYDAYNELKAMFEKQAGVERFELIQTFHACKQEEGKPVAAYVIQMKGYVDQLECLGYVLPHEIIVGLILNGLTKDFSGFVRNYNMHNIGKTIGELHDMLIEYEKGLPKKAETPQVMMIKGGKIQKANKKSLKVKGKGKANVKGKDKQVYIPKPKNPKPSSKEHPTKDDACHHYKEVGHWKRNCPMYLAELLKKKKAYSSHTHHNIMSVPEWRMYFVRHVRSMMNHTTLGCLKGECYFVRHGNLLDMVPTKKVDTTPYELKSMQASRSIYGLKQASELRIKRFERKLKGLDLAQNLESHVYIKRDRSKRLIGLGQNAYIDKILKRYRMDNSKLGHIPMQERLDLNKTQGASTPKEVKRMQNVPLWLRVSGSCMDCCENILKYLRNTKDDVFGLWWICLHFEWRRSRLEELKQSTTAMSATVANDIAASNAAMKLFRLGRFIYGWRIRFLKVHTDDNQADPFTKALPKGKLTQHARSIGLRLASNFM
ncbi:retrovirus-related pol polyprotein from transposon TNT 1-94 [Tanacetum coccineum]